MRAATRSRSTARVFLLKIGNRVGLERHSIHARLSHQLEGVRSANLEAWCSVGVLMPEDGRWRLKAGDEGKLCCVRLVQVWGSYFLMVVTKPDGTREVSWVKIGRSDGHRYSCHVGSLRPDWHSKCMHLATRNKQQGISFPSVVHEYCVSAYWNPAGLLAKPFRAQTAWSGSLHAVQSRSTPSF